MKNLWSGLLLVIVVAFQLSGCGGGGGGGTVGAISNPADSSTIAASNSVPAPSVPTVPLDGTVASGAPVPDTNVVIIDSKGKTLTTTTDANGNYSADIGSLVPPLLLEVNTSGGTLYSLAIKDDAVCNVTPMTQLVLNVYFQLQGTTASEVFNAISNGGSPQLPTKAELSLAAYLAMRAVAKELADSGIAYPSFDPFTSKFTANHQGFDAFLDSTTFSTNGQGQAVLTSTHNGIQIVSTFAVDLSVADSPRLVTTITTTNQTTGAVTTDRDVTVVPPRKGSALENAVEGVNQSLSDFADVVNSKGSSLTDQDLLPFIASGYLNDGYNQAQAAARLATLFRGVTIKRIAVNRVDSFDAANNIMVVSSFPNLAQGSIDQDENVRMVLKLDPATSTWQRFGNHQIAHCTIYLENLNLLDASGSAISSRLMAGASAPETAEGVSTVSGVTLSDNVGIFSNIPLTQFSRPVMELLKPTPTTTLQILDDRFFTQGTASTQPPIDTPFTFTVQPASGAPVNYVKRTGGSTSEVISMTVLADNSPVGHSLADANLGSPITAQWTLPTTFTVAHLMFTGNVFTTHFVQQVQPTTLIGIGDANHGASTTADITLPQTITQHGITENVHLVVLTVSVGGIQGERVSVDYVFK